MPGQPASPQGEKRNCPGQKFTVALPTHERVLKNVSTLLTALVSLGRLGQVMSATRFDEWPMASR